MCFRKCSGPTAYLHRTSTAQLSNYKSWPPSAMMTGRPRFVAVSTAFDSGISPRTSSPSSSWMSARVSMSLLSARTGSAFRPGAGIQRRKGTGDTTVFGVPIKGNGDGRGCRSRSDMQGTLFKRPLVFIPQIRHHQATARQLRYD